MFIRPEIGGLYLRLPGFSLKKNKIKLISKERENKEIKKINLLISTMIFDWWVHS